MPLSGQMQYSYFPVKLQDLSSRIHFTELEEGLFRIGDVLVETQYLNHTAPTIAYRISYGGSTVAYVTDHEPYWNNPGPIVQHPGDQRHIEFLKNADLVIHDAQYSEEEYRTKLGWGHSTDRVRNGRRDGSGSRAGLRCFTTILHTTTIRSWLSKPMPAHARRQPNSRIEVFAAAEGLTVELNGAVSKRAEAESPRFNAAQSGAGVSLWSLGIPSDSPMWNRTLSEDALVINGVSDGQTAIERAAELQPDLVILGSTLADGDGANFIQPIRSVLQKPDLPILIFTEEGDSQDNLHHAGQIATDYLALPYSPPMLRSRVRSWLARTMGPDPRTPTPLPSRLSR